MNAKINKILSFIRIILKKPSLINFVLDSPSVAEERFKKYYPNFNALPQIGIEQLSNVIPEKIETFILDGGSLITDLQLLSALAARKDINSYLEIGTWRGESVYNVAKQIDDCTTINLSHEEMKLMGLSREYAEQHAVLSSKNPRILHIGANTRTFDFASLNKKYDLVFIDGEHSYEMVLNDTQKVFRHLIHDHSIVVWHDYAFSPQNIRYEVFQAILDGVGSKNHHHLYHPKNTMCAVFTKTELKSSAFDQMKFPENLFSVHVEKHLFEQNKTI
jgi:predicted O-methyltransferase YrrM